jgi:uncharacterized membrane protein SpoIIM required for sporulation/ABC-type transport system involved in multi-copper enzyme maturation permease subunit
MANWLNNNLRPALVITRRELKDQLRDWRIIIPIIMLTVFFPWLMNFTARQAVEFVESYGAPVVAERLVPFLLMVVGFFPVSISLVIALESFVGEKERRSIEPLLTSPLSNGQLYLGKLLAAVLTPLLASYLGISIYFIGVTRQVNWAPDPTLIVQILLLNTVQAFVMVSGAVVISSQATSVRAANLLASFIIIPMALLIQGESVVMFWGRYPVLWWAIAGLLVIAGLLIRSGLAHFNREELIGQELDTINLFWSWRVFLSELGGGVKSPLGWYRNIAGLVAGRMLVPISLTALLLIAATWIGTNQAKVFVLPPDLIQFGDIQDGMLRMPELINFYSVSGVGTVWLHNIRAIFLASILGIFSFGVLGMVVLMLPLVLIGYFMASLSSAGISPALFLTAFILPHGILEIPAMILAGGAILRLGARLASPAQGLGIGEAMLRGVADWCKVMLGLVVPMLLGAAILEVFVTPRVVQLLLGGN